MANNNAKPTKENGEKSRYSEQGYANVMAYKRAYREEHYIERALRIKKHEKEAYLDAAKSEGLSLNAWMNKTCKEYAQKG